MPATLTVLILAGLAACVGVWLIVAALKPAERESVCQAQGCGHENPVGARFCAACGAELPRRARPRT